MDIQLFIKGENMKKKIVSCILAVALITSGCSLGKDIGETNGISISGNQEGENAGVDEQGQTSSEDGSQQSADVNISVSAGPTLLGDSEEKYYDENLVPQIPSYSVNEDLSNVVISSRQEYHWNPERASEYNDVNANRAALAKNNFVVIREADCEFFDVYEGNRYNQTPNFITVDSLMHTYHLYFSYLMKQCEKGKLSDDLKTLSAQMLETSKKQYEECKGTDFEGAALRNLEFFYIGSKLLDDGVSAPVSDSSFDSVVNGVIDKINSAEGIEVCPITELNEDYSQYKPRGYYEGDEQLEKYFRAMMWYGRVAFALDKEDMVRSAILQSIAIGEGKETWEEIYSITSFFAGSSDDPGYVQMSEIVNSCFGGNDIASVKDNKDGFNKVMSAVKEIQAPAINSVAVEDGEESVIPSYRFMGQRFSIDAAIMQKLIYSAVKENSTGEKRMLPDALDTAAALGSDKAMEILESQGATEYQNYKENMETVKGLFNNDDPAIWNASLYSGWLNTLRPLFEEKGEGYPSYMQNPEWTKKNLETYAGSYAELKHDTILYVKQNMAEMGDGDEETLDDRGFVDTQPVVFSRFKFLSEKTKEGLDRFGILDDQKKEDLDKLSEIAGTLLTISEKELKNEKLSDEDYEFIRCYGGYLEHFWKEASNEGGESVTTSDQAPCPIIADIATDPNGSVLEVGTGFADTIYVVFPIDGELHLGSGSVYSFYQFEQPIDERLTDDEWRDRLRGGHMDENWNWVENSNQPTSPDWTSSYKVGQ